MNDDGAVERGSGTVAECVNRIGFPRGDLSGWFPRHAGKPASQSAKSNEPIIPANAKCVADTSLLLRIRENLRMNSDCKSLLSLLTLPARLSRTQAADYLGFEPDHITLLIKAGLLKPLGRPKPNSDKYFAAVKLAELRQDEQWLSRATQFISQHWQDKNARKSKCSNRMALTTEE